MLYEEAQWIGNTLQEICQRDDKILNIGSSSLYSRTVAQPHMEEFIFRPLRDSEVSVIHTDIQNCEGVDLVGDLTDKNFIDKIKAINVDGIICSNLLEHLENRKEIIETIDTIIPKGGFGLITVPYIYPYHLDPIDTMYRPTTQELASQFDGYEVIKLECVEAQRVSKIKFQKNYFEMLMNDKKLALRILLRSFMPFYKYTNWRYTVTDLLKMFKPFSVTCILIKKN